MMVFSIALLYVHAPLYAIRCNVRLLQVVVVTGRSKGSRMSLVVFNMLSSQRFCSSISSIITSLGTLNEVYCERESTTYETSKMFSDNLKC